MQRAIGSVAAWGLLGLLAASPALGDRVRMRNVDRVNKTFFRFTIVLTNSHCGNSACEWHARGIWRPGGRCDITGEGRQGSSWFVDGMWGRGRVTRERYTLYLPAWRRGRFCFEHDPKGTADFKALGSATLERRRVCSGRCRWEFYAVHHPAPSR